MRLIITILVASLLLTACSHTYYVVRHAEKANPSPGNTMSSPNDPPLSEAGRQRAETLKETLKDSKIKYIFSTNTVRTTTTAEPLAKAQGLTTEIYGPMPDSAFIQKLKGIKKNVVIVGHSNTVDDIVNGLTGTKTVPGDLQDSEYSNLYLIIVRGKKVRFEHRNYGAIK